MSPGRNPWPAAKESDVGSHKLLVGQGWRATKPNSFLTTNGGSSMGFSVPAAIVAKMLHRDRQVVCTVGDGGFAMSSADLRLASSMKLGVVVVVFCDNSLNRIELKQTVKKYASVLTRFDPTDLVKLAEAMECHGARVENPGELGVGGDVEPGSIIRKGRQVSFVLRQDKQTIQIVYDGTAPLPDTLKDGAQALADGRLGPDSVFRASQVQAKCASKYETQPGQAHPANIPIRKAGV